MSTFLAASFLRPFASRLGRRGVDPIELASALGIPTDFPKDRRIQLYQAREYCERGAVACGEADFGVRVASGRRTAPLGLLDFAARTATTLEQVLRAYASFGVLFRDGFEAKVDTTKQEIRCTFLREDDPLGLGRHGNEFKTVTALRVIWEVAKLDAPPSRVWFSHPAPPASSIAAIQAATRASEAVFGQPDNGAAWPLSMATMRVFTGDQKRFDYFSRQLAQDVERIPRSAAILQVRRKLRELLLTGSADAKLTASALNTSVRSLQRRLESEGTHFLRVLDDVRDELARHELLALDTSASEIGRKLGYASEKAFVRAFRRWNGMSPDKYRRLRTRAAGQGES